MEPVQPGLKRNLESALMPPLIGSSYVTFVLNLSLALDEPVSVSYATEHHFRQLIHACVVSLEALLVDLWHQLTRVVLKKRGLV